MPVSSATAPTSVGAATSGGPKKFYEPEVREKMAAAVQGQSRRKLAKLTGATTEGARHWLEGDRCPSTTNTLALAQGIPAVRDLLLEWLGARDVEAQSLDAVMRALSRIAAGQGEEAQRARQMIFRLNGVEP